MIRALEYWLRQYRRTWRGTAVGSFLTPLLYLLALGVGVGSLAALHDAAPAGRDYQAFVAPGLLAAVAMQTAATEATYPVMAAMRWHKAYHAMRRSPLEVTDIFLGHLAFIALRVCAVAAVFMMYMGILGTLRSPWAVLALVAAVLTGTAYAAWFAAYSAWVRRDASLTILMRFGVLPMFLLCGVLYPAARLPTAVRAVVYITPLWHGAELCRSLTAGSVRPGPDLAHAAVLTAWLLAGALVARAVYRKGLA